MVYLLPPPAPGYGSVTTAAIASLTAAHQNSFFDASYDYYQGGQSHQEYGNYLSNFLPAPAFQTLQPYVERLSQAKETGDPDQLLQWVNDLPPTLSQGAVCSASRDRLVTHASQASQRAAGQSTAVNPSALSASGTGSDEDGSDEDEYEDEEEELPFPPCGQGERAPSSTKPDVPPEASVAAATSSEPADTWPLNPSLRGGDAHYYRGPLSASEVLSLLKQELKPPAYRALTGSHANYMRCFHFRGFSPPDPARRRPAAKDSQDKMSEQWQCRVCHGFLHVPRGQVSNLGAHLFGSVKRTGCLKKNGGSPCEPLPTGINVSTTRCESVE
ncbi:hypothetical protein A4X13_0g7141 [Tilletia indica]|uniref:Uncharacterized protein n=1 Tax=Tilletia indica TaxID=43049 RepID=A0A177TLS2_9BASI|nr:hypothetical protein A4X13_0g7141 [Tilletia indica]